MAPPWVFPGALPNRGISNHGPCRAGAWRARVGVRGRGHSTPRAEGTGNRYSPSDARLRRHCDWSGSQRPDRGDGHGPGWSAGPVRGEEPLHRRDGVDDRADPRLPLRAGRLHPVPRPEPDLRGSGAGRLPDLRARGPVRQHQRGRPAADFALLGSGAAPGAPRRDDRDRGGARDGRGGGMGRGPGTRHRPLRRPDATQVARRDVGLRRQRVGAGGHPHRHVRQCHGCGRPVTCRTR